MRAVSSSVDEVVCIADSGVGRLGAGCDAEVCASFEPEIIRQTGGNARRRVVLLAVRGRGQKRVVDIGRRGASFDRRPTHVFHDDEENRLHVGEGTALRGKGWRQKNSAAKQRQSNRPSEGSNAFPRRTTHKPGRYFPPIRPAANPNSPDGGLSGLVCFVAGTAANAYTGRRMKPKRHVFALYH